MATVDARIMRLERAAATHWRAPVEERLGEWLLRAGDGFTGRANSALPAGDPGMALDEAVAYVTGWYRAHGLPPMLAVPTRARDDATTPLDDYLVARGWGPQLKPAYVMTAQAVDVKPPRDDVTVRFDDRPDDAWRALYRYRGELPPASALSLLMSAPFQEFASVEDAGGATIAIARLSLDGEWAGITAVEVAREHRRRGLATAITSALAAEAARRRARRMFLQVDAGNMAARALYARCGFCDAHRYHYRVAPTE